MNAEAEKIVINMGIGEARETTARRVELRQPIFGLIAGQKAVITKASKSIATFRCVMDGRGMQGDARKTRMYEFLNGWLPSRCRACVTPRPVTERASTGRQLHDRPQGAITSGDRLRQGRPDIWGMDITVCTSAKTDDEASARCSRIHFPSGSEGEVPSDAKKAGDFNAKKSSNRKEQAARKAGPSSNAETARPKLKAIANDKTTPMEERFAAALKSLSCRAIFGDADSQSLHHHRAVPRPTTGSSR